MGQATPKRRKRNEPTRLTFSKTRVAALPAPETGRTYVYDRKVPGLAVCVTASGTRTFYMYRSLNGRPKRVRIGRFPDLSVEQARRRAHELLAEMARGIDPTAARRAARQALTFREAWQAFLAHGEARNRPSTVRENRRIGETYLRPLMSRKLAEITRDDVAALHARVGKRGKYQANRLLAAVSACYGHVAPGLDNPAKGVKRFKERSRDRFLDAEELHRFFRALDAEPAEHWRDFFLLTLLTGARKANVLSMAWADVNLARGVWRIPADEAKGDEPLVCVLADPAVAILRRRAAAANGDRWVFPSAASASGHRAEPKKAWAALCSRGGFVDGDGKATLRIHDLRRTLGSWQAIGGSSLNVIGRSLGHRNQATTAIYARLTDNVVRASVETATAAILAAGNGANATDEGPPPRR